jgi:hypothetical protein
MDIHTERDTEIRVEPPEVYEPPMLEEIGGFAALTRASSRGSAADGTGYYSE